MRDQGTRRETTQQRKRWVLVVFPDGNHRLEGRLEPWPTEDHDPGDEDRS